MVKPAKCCGITVAAEVKVEADGKPVVSGIPIPVTGNRNLTIVSPQEPAFINIWKGTEFGSKIPRKEQPVRTTRETLVDPSPLPRPPVPGTPPHAQENPDR